MFIVFEGIDCSGKTTQLHLLKNYLSEQGYNVLFSDGKGEFSKDLITKIKSSPNQYDWVNDYTFLFAFLLDRQSYLPKIKRALQSGFIVLLDRYIPSTLVYQGYAGNIDLDLLYRLHESSVFNGDLLTPDLIIFLDVPLKEVQKRMEQRKNQSSYHVDHFENKSAMYFDGVIRGFRKLFDGDRNVFTVCWEEYRDVQEIHLQIRQKVIEMLNRE